jgi:hypothetical protein
MRAGATKSVALLYVSLALGACSGGGAAGSDSGIDASSDGHTHPEGGGPHDARSGTDSTTPVDSTAPAKDSGNGHDGGTDGGTGATFGGCPLFAPGYAYNQDISNAAVDPSSPSYITNLDSLAPNIAAEFPGGEFYNVVPSTQAEVPVQTSAAYGFLPDGGFFYDQDAALAAVTAPIPSGVAYENSGTPNADHHMMVLQQGTCLLYELYAANPSSATSGWSVMVEWNLHGSPEIPGSYDIGSTTQAGTPLLPGIIWPAEVQSGEIRHALDIVMADNAIMPCAYVPPASTVRYSGAPAGQGIPYGAHLRLRSSFDTSSFTGTQALVVVRALEKYGMIPTDASGESRSVFRLGQDTDGGTLDQADMNQLNVLTWSDFEVMTLGNVIHPAGCAP